jgi:hypothetical protein
MQERRQPPRTRVLKAAKVIFNEHRSVIDCTVRNLSNSGACLQVSSPVGFPESFDLSFDSFRSVRRCQVRWRAENKIGVSFTEAGSGSSLLRRGS